MTPITRGSYTALKPQAMNETFARAFNSGVVDNLLALYEPTGQHVRRDGSVAADPGARYADLQDLLNLGGVMTSKTIYAHVSGDLALLRAAWRLVTVDAEGQPLELTGHTVEIVRRQADGCWLYVIDHPFGAEPLTILVNVHGSVR